MTPPQKTETCAMSEVASAGRCAKISFVLVVSDVVLTSKWIQNDLRSSVAFDGKVMMAREFGEAVTAPFG